jgi:tetratricopeptide (TPR) repeat protein
MRPIYCTIWLGLLLAGVGLFVGCQTVQKTATAKKGSPTEGRPQPLTEEARILAYSHYAAGLSHDLNGHPEEALQEYTLSLKANPAYEPLLLDVIRRLLRNQQNDAAIEVLQRAAAAGLANGSVYGWLGLAYAHAGKPDLAIGANRLAIAKTPGALGAYQNLSQLYLQTARTNLALEVLEEAAKQKNVDADFLIGLEDIFARLAKGGIIKDEEAKQRRLEFLDRAAEAPAQGAGLTWQKLADGYLALGQFAKAKPLYEKVLKEAPDIPMTREKLINVYLRLGDKPQAIKLLEEIRRENPTDPQNYFFLGGMAYEQKNFAQAAEYYETALQLSPDFEQLYYDLAGLQISLKKSKEALEVLAKARSRFKLNFTMEFYSGVAQSLLENYPAAVSYFTSAEIVAKATDPSRLTPQFYYQAGAAYERAGQRTEAEKQFRKALEKDPDYAEALNYLGYMWAERGENLDESLRFIEKAVKLQPKNAAFLDSLGWVLHKLKRPAEALSQMQSAISLNGEPDATLYDHLGDIQAALKQYDQARMAWKKSIQVQPSAEIQKKIENLPRDGSSSSQP